MCCFSAYRQDGKRFDGRLKDYEKAIKNAGIKITIEVKDYNARHPGTYKLTLKNNKETHKMRAISTDEVIETMDKVGKSIPFELRCTALGGLSVTKTSKIIEERLKKQE